MRLQGKAAIITGVSYKGQAGYALARAFAREGADLVICARNKERIVARAEELRAEGANVVLPVAADLTTEEGAKDLVQAAIGAYERVDILVNLAGGLTKVGPSDELSLADWQSELNNNLLTTFLCTRAVWSTMRSQGGGKILNFSRASSIEGAGPNMAAYNSAKAGVDALTRTFAKEGEKLGIYVNAIGPGLLVTESNLAGANPSPEELLAGWVPLRLLAEVAVFLASTASDGVNGAIVPVKARSV
jgi:NAD(P)-dependent dehydrogenase (short-subunit alcohol dehydrogenase family)